MYIGTTLVFFDLWFQAIYQASLGFCLLGQTYIQTYLSSLEEIGRGCIKHQQCQTFRSAKLCSHFRFAALRRQHCKRVGLNTPKF